MNFYEHQDRARRRTTLLATYFVLAVVLIVVAINTVVYLAANAAREVPLSLAEWFDRPWWGFVSAAVLVVIVGHTLVTTLRLAGGGPALARMLGARRVPPDASDLDERRLLNIVEEMSIASGVPVPALYVLDREAGINAFVAGTRPSETIMVVTRGALASFSRDEMQGVVAHEYSHIFNHDMALNLHLMGALAGLIVIGQVGRLMLRSGSHGNSRDGSRLALVGLAILVIGYVGSFFGALIKAAISRQREFLADASAVQFTRNPDGIAHALYRIKQHAEGSLLDNAHAEDIGHFCFGESVHYALSGLMATHPPLDARIRAVAPRFEPPPPRTARVDRQPDPGPGPDTDAAPGAASFAGASARPALDGERVAAAVGTVTPARVAGAHALHAALPAAVLGAARDPARATDLVVALLLQASIPQAWNEVLGTAARAGHDRDAVEELARALAALPARGRLPLLNLALPALKSLDPDARAGFRRTVRAVVRADRRLSVFEFALVHLLDDHLDDAAPRAVPVRHFSFAAVAGPLRLLLSVLAHAGSASPDSVAAAFDVAWRPFGLGEAGPVARDACRLDALDAALDELARLSPLLKQNVIRACADCVIHDFTVTAAEEELLAALAISLDCPLPPLLDG